MLDCSELIFLDCTALVLLLRYERQLGTIGGGLTLLWPSRLVRRVLDVTGAADCFTVIE